MLRLRIPTSVSPYQPLGASAVSDLLLLTLRLRRHIILQPSFSVVVRLWLGHSSCHTCNFSWRTTATLPGAATVSGLAAQFSRVPLCCGGVGMRSGSSQEQHGAVMHGKSFVILHMKTLYRALCCAFIGDEGGKVWFQTAGACNVQSHSKIRRRAKLEASIYFWTPRGNILHCFLVWDVALFDLHRDAIAAFPGSLVSDWTVALNTWNKNRYLEDSGWREDTTERARMAQTPRRPDKREKFDLDIMALETINLEEVVKD